MTLSIVSDLQHYDSQLAEVDKMLEQMYKMLGCTLTTIPGVNVITAVKILAEIGDIKRFSNANKLAQFAGIAPLHLSSSGKGKDVATKQGNRRLQATIYFLAIQMVQVSSKGTPRNSVVRAYYEKRKAEGKTLWLFALDHRVSFYTGIGFEAVSHENVIQRSDSLIEHEKR